MSELRIPLGLAVLIVGALACFAIAGWKHWRRQRAVRRFRADWARQMALRPEPGVALEVVGEVAAGDVLEITEDGRARSIPFPRGMEGLAGTAAEAGGPGELVRIRLPVAGGDDDREYTVDELRERVGWMRSAR